MLATNPLLPPALVKRESQFGSRVFAISTANELEILTKVRDYIRLNENYNEYMLLKSSTTSAAPAAATNSATKPAFIGEGGEHEKSQEVAATAEAPAAAASSVVSTANKVTNETEVLPVVANKQPESKA